MAEPLFVLGGVVFPWNPAVDWSNDGDVLLDAARETYVAARLHHTATLTPDRDWLVCECLDPAQHRDLLYWGLDSVMATMAGLPAKEAEMRVRAPLLYLVRFVQTIAIAVTALTVLS